MPKKELTTEEIKKIETDILMAIHDFCEERQLRYCLWGGTLLGAIRHDGFIPWDDDVDIAMPREDFEVFVKEFDCEQYGVYSSEINSGHPFWHAKAYHKGTCKIEPICYKKNYSIGVDVDIFPLDTYEDFAAVEKTTKWRAMEKKKYGISLIPFRKTRLKPSMIGLVCRIFLGWNANKTARAVNKRGSSFGREGSGLMLYADSNLKKPLRLEKAWFENRVLHVFEERMVYIPEGYDALLRACYGDYMTLPPEEKRVTHHAFEVYYK